MTAADPDPETPRHERLVEFPAPEGKNSTSIWTSVFSPPKVMFYYLVIWLVSFTPSLKLKRVFLRRLLGMDVGKRVAWGPEATPDMFYPKIITVEDDVIMGYDTLLITHEFLPDEVRVGEIVVGEGAMIGAGTTILPGVHVGPDAKVAINSVVTEDVPAGMTVGGTPAEPIGESARTDDADDADIGDADGELDGQPAD